MDEELIDYLFETSRREGFKKNREDFVKYLQSDDELFDYLYGKAQKEGYKKDKAHFAGLVGRTTTAAPVATTEPTTTEPAKTEPAKTEVATTTTTPAKTEPAKTEPAVTVAAETAPAKTEVVAETKTEPQITVKEVEAPVKEEPKKELPVSTGLTPITEKTEVKAVETPSDKMVIKSEKKEEPVKVPSYKGIDKNLDIAGGVFIDKSNISEGLDAKDLSPKEILDNDLLGKNWHTIELNRNVSSRYPDPPNVNTKNLKSYNQDENFNVFKPIDIDGKKFYSNYDKKNNKWYLYEEGSNKDNWTEVKADPIKSMLSSKYLKYGQPIKESRDYSESDYNEIESAKKKLSYSKYLQYLVSNVNDLSPEEKSKVKEILGDKNNDKMYRWISYNVEDPKIADFWVNALEKLDIQSSYLDDIKKRRDDLTQQPQGTMQVKEVTEQPKVEVKVEEPKMEVKEVTKEEPKMVIKSENKAEVNQQNPTFSKPIIINGAKFDDDMNLMRTFRPAGFEEYKELSKLAKPVDKSLDEIAQSFSKHFESIQLDRNISLSFPDPPNAKKKSVVTQNTENIFEDKIDNKNVYSYYDEKNKKWYIYNKEKDENNWNEVTSPQIKTVLNTKYKNNSGEIDKSKIFKTEEAEADKIIKIKEYYYYNKYLPTLIENWDNLKENQKESIKKDLNVLLMKRLSRDMYHKEKYKEEINDIKEKIKRNETVNEIDMNILKFGNPDERYDKFWEYVVEKTGAGDEEVKALIKKYKQ